MAEPYVGEIRMAGFNFAPQGWAFCNGQILAISEFDTLFNLIGTTYGGDGQTTFALPDLQGRLPIHQGQSGGTSNYVIGERSGTEYIILTLNQMPAHVHTLTGSTDAAASRSPIGTVPAHSTRAVYGAGTGNAMAPTALAAAGSSQPHVNMQPFVCVNFIISLFGVFPSQN